MSCETFSRSPSRIGRQGHLAPPSLAIVGEHRADGLLLLPVAAERFERRSEIVDDGLDTELVRHRAAQAHRIPRRVALGHQHAQDAILAERPDAEGGDDRAIHPARQPYDGPTPVERAECLLADHTLDLLDRGSRIDPEDVPR